MARGSISNNSTTVLPLLLIGLICLTTVVRGMEWIVGEEKGWRVPIRDTWPGDRPISTGDTLVFKYDPDEHDVVEVDEESYNICHVPHNAKKHKSGNDHIKIPHCKTGTCRMFFVCSVGTYCHVGMKISVSFS